MTAMPKSNSSMRILGKKSTSDIPAFDAIRENPDEYDSNLRRNQTITLPPGMREELIAHELPRLPEEYLHATGDQQDVVAAMRDTSNSTDKTLLGVRRRVQRDRRAHIFVLLVLMSAIVVLLFALRASHREAGDEIKAIEPPTEPLRANLAEPVAPAPAQAENKFEKQKPVSVELPPASRTATSTERSKKTAAATASVSTKSRAPKAATPAAKANSELTSPLLFNPQ